MLTRLLEQLDEDNVLLLVLPRAGQDIQRTRWFKSLEAFGVLFKFGRSKQRICPGGWGIAVSRQV